MSTYPSDPPILKILRRVTFGTGSKFGTDVAKRYGKGSEVLVFLKVARLQSEFCTKDFFRATNFLTKNAPKISPEIFEPLFCGSEKIPGKSPPNFPLDIPNFPAINQKKFTDELLQERREKLF